MDARSPRDGRAIEELGHYDPLVRNTEGREVLKVSRIRYWLSVGAQPSEKVAAILKRHGIKKPAPGESWEVAEPEAPAVPPSLKTSAAPAPVIRPKVTTPATDPAETEAPAQAAAPTEPPASTVPPEPGAEQP